MILQSLAELPLNDKLTIISWVISGAIYLLSRIHKLPKSARKWLKSIGYAEIERLIREAETIADLNGVARRLYVADKLSEITGGKIPAPIANLIIEFVYARIQKRLGK